MADELERLLGQRFIARTDVKAEQQSNGNYIPVRDRDNNNLPWTGQDIRDHVAGKRTFGHYVVAPGDFTKILCFDIDVRKIRANDPDDKIVDWDGNVLADKENPGGAVQLWRSDVDSEQHKQIAIALSCMAEVLSRRVVSLLEIPTAVAYSGSKGLHVYGLFEPVEGQAIPANDARASALVVIDDLKHVFASHGKNFFRHYHGSYSAIEIEVFPKQDSLKDGSYGNLVRLPLGVNRKSGNKGFFIQFGPPPYEFEPLEPMLALNGVNPWPKHQKRPTPNAPREESANGTA